MIEPQESSTKTKVVFSQIDLERYDITDCLDILRYLQTFSKPDMQTEDFKSFSYRLECRIKNLVLKK